MIERELEELCLDITDLCPMKCIHCSSFTGSAGKTLRIEEIEKIIDEAAGLGGKILELSGGEPLSHPTLPEIVKHAKRHDFEVRLYTSGFPLTETVLRDLVRSRLDKVIFNLQGSTANVHEQITQTAGSFEKAISAIKACKNHFWVGVHFVPMKPNYEELGDVLQLCSSLKVDEMAILRFVAQGRGMLNRKRLELSQVEFEETARTISEKCHSTTETEIRIGHPLNYCSIIDNSIHVPQCQAGTSTCTIRPNGDVIPCSAFKENHNYIAGNIKIESLSSIWMLSHVWNHFREFDYRKLRQPCKICKRLLLCQGGCKAQRILNYNDIYQGPDPLCIASEL